MPTLPRNFVERPCKACGVVFLPKPYATTMAEYCSHRCRNAAYYARVKSAADDEEEFSPDVWDGKTMHSDPPDYERYAAVCLACGARTDVTAKQAELLSRCSARCSTCRGNVLVERDDIGSVGSPRLVSSDLYETMKAVWRSGATA